MKAYKISDLKNFMNKLLLSECFDYFLLEEGTIVTYNIFQIDGHIQNEFFTKEELEDKEICPYAFSSWKDIRPICFQLIKGRKAPLSFKFVLLLQPEHMKKILSRGGYEDNSNRMKAFSVSVKYDGTAATLITGISTTSFLMDKAPGELWDVSFGKFLDKSSIAWQEI